MDCNLLGSTVHGILQARIPEWVAVPSSRGSSQPRNHIRVSFTSCIACRFFTRWATKEILMSGLFDIYIYSILNSRYLVSTPTFLKVIFSYYIPPCLFFFLLAAFLYVYIWSKFLIDNILLIHMLYSTLFYSLSINIKEQQHNESQRNTWLIS